MDHKIKPKPLKTKKISSGLLKAIKKEVARAIG